MQSFCHALCVAAAVLIYLNTLPAKFAFDDNFAVGKREICLSPSMHTSTGAAPCILRR